MDVTRATELPEVLFCRPRLHHDDRGLVFEAWQQERFDAAVGRQVRFVQENHSRSSRHVLRGIHYQLEQPQGKLVRVVAGAVWDVAVDLRRSSPTFGRWAGIRLDADGHDQIWVPEGFGHGFVALSDSVDLVYLMTDYYRPDLAHTVVWDDPTLAIDWPLDGAAPVLSPRDAAAPGLGDADLFP